MGNLLKYQSHLQIFKYARRLQSHVNGVGKKTQNRNWRNGKNVDASENDFNL